MRRTVRIAWSGQVAWRALAGERTFLYRRIADKGISLLGVGALRELDQPEFDGTGRVNDWTFGHLCYDLKDVLEPGLGGRASATDLPRQHWFVPRWVFVWDKDGVVLHAGEADLAAGIRMGVALFKAEPVAGAPWRSTWQLQTDRETYLARAERLLAHIHRGDIYEVNYCITRTATIADADPFSAFARLMERSDAPYAAFHRLGDRFALCASPERFLAFEGDRVVAQPMKGTRPRSMDVGEDRRLAEELANDPKERSENIMALDVARHDLSRVAASRSVLVEELCAVRSHPRVHQLVSTVSARLRPGRTPFDAVLAAFPMASMTGAPKFRAMQLIDEAEDRPRGLYSGSLGYFAPDGTGDLNVVIRTILFDARTGVASLTTGSALTALCDPVAEWEECALKARSVTDALTHDR